MNTIDLFRLKSIKADITENIRIRGRFMIEEIVPDSGGSILPGSGEINSRIIFPNMILDTGVVEIVKWLANSGSPQSAGWPAYMAAGSGTTAAAHDDEGLENELDRVAADLTAETEVASSADKILQAIGYFYAGVGKSTLTEFSLQKLAAAGGGDIAYNRGVVTPARDNENNDLRVTYQSLIAPVA